MFWLFLMLVSPEYIKFHAFERAPGISLQRLLFVVIFPLIVYLVYEELSKGKVNRQLVIYMLTIVFLCFSMSVSLISSDYQSATVKKIFFFIENSILIFLVVVLYRKKLSFQAFSLMFVWAATCINLTSILEFFNQSNIFESMLLSKTDEIMTVVEGQSRNGLHRVSSVFLNPLTLSIYVVALTPLLFCAYKKVSKFYRFLIILNLLIGPFVVYTTDSRGGMGLILFVYLAFVLYFLKQKIMKNQRKLILLLLGFIFTMGVAGVLFSYGIMYFYSMLEGEGRRYTSILQRIEQYDVVLFSLFPEKFLFGYGYGSANEVVFPLMAVDNMYLSILLEMGAVGLIIYLAMLTLSVKYVHKTEYSWPIVLILVFFLISSSTEIYALFFILVALGFNRSLVWRTDRLL